MANATQSLPTLEINKRSVAALANPSVLAGTEGSDDWTIPCTQLTIDCSDQCTPWTTDTTHYPQCNPSSYSGCVCGC
jgi:hypothetical protein